jgi:glycosyltransferase involved in cell wall biosynthesis
MSEFNISNAVFKTDITIDTDAHVIVVADLFAEDYIGGAELTTQSLIDESPFKIQKIKSGDVTLKTLQDGVSKFWIFGNFANLNPQLIPSIVANMKYSILEYDYKYCKYRSPEKHEELTKKPCDCHDQINGKLVSAFYYGSVGMWWMSEGQRSRYHRLFPFLSEKSSIVLSSVFDKKSLGTIKLLREHTKQAGIERKGWIVLGSDSWVKGSSAAENWCISENKTYEKVWGVDYETMLSKLATSEGFVYLPAGADTCPRMVIEAKLLGCKLHINENVQHGNEEWFSTDNIEEIEEYLYQGPQLFWNGITAMMNYKPMISGYTTVYNAASQEYPFVECIESMLQFCDEVCVVDGGSTDGTWEMISGMAAVNPQIKVKQIERDWQHPRFGVFDGMQKAEARMMCTGEYCWQMDCDEIVHEEDAEKIVTMCRKFPKNVDLISLPVIEYWGGEHKVRVDIQPWKWRLSRNKPNITHGIPADARRIDENGDLYAAYGDGCDMIDSSSYERIPHLSFYTKEAEVTRHAALNGNQEALKAYQVWFNSAISQLPGVYHYSWFDIERKIKLYKKFWTRHWESLSGKKYEDTADTNMMFDVPWSEVTDEMITSRAKELADKLGGWIWHKKWNGTAVTPYMTIEKQQPSRMKKS